MTPEEERRKFAWLDTITSDQMDSGGIQRLIEAICGLAAEEYRYLIAEGVEINPRQSKVTRTEIELFFRSPWFSTLCNNTINGNDVIAILKAG